MADEYLKDVNWGHEASQLLELASKLQASLRALHSVEMQAHQRDANIFLSEWRTTRGSWMQAAQLIQLSSEQQASASNSQKPVDEQTMMLSLGADETHFLASVLHEGIQKDSKALEDGIHDPLIKSLVATTKSLWGTGLETHATRVQLCLCISTLVVRHASWNPPTVLRQLWLVFQESSTQLAQPVVTNDALDNCAIQWLGPLVELLALLPEVCQNRKISVHPARRESLVETLQASEDIVKLWEACAVSHDHRAAMALLRGMRSFAELGRLPPGLCSSQTLVQISFRVIADGSNQLSNMGAQAVMAMCSSAGGDMEAMTTLLEGNAALISHFPPEQWNSRGLNSEFCELLVNCWTTIGMTGGTALVHSASGSGPLLLERTQELLDTVLETSLTCLRMGSEEIVAAVLDMWDTGIVSVLSGMPSGQEAQQAVLQRLAPYLEAYVKALVSRSALHGVDDSFLTGDARDLPSDVRALRRELGAEIRSLTDLVGARDMLVVLSGLVEEALQLWQASCSSGRFWQPLEAALYACNIASAKTTAEPGMADVMGRVIQGALALSADPETARAPKLAGTALVFVGGLHTWLVVHPPWLSAVLDLCTVALQSNEEQLVRNGATAFLRLTCNPSTSHILAVNSSFSLPTEDRQASQDLNGEWCRKMMQVLQSRGGVRHRAPPGTDVGTEQMLLVGLCSVAVSIPETNSACDAVSQLVSPIASEIQQIAAVLPHVASSEALNTFCNLLGVICAVLEGVMRADMEIDLQMCLWRLACQVVGAGQDIANLLTKQNHHQQASQVANAICEILGAAIGLGDNTIKLGGMQSFQQICCTTTPDLVFTVLETGLPQLWSGPATESDLHFTHESETLVREIFGIMLGRLEGTFHEDPAQHAQVMRLGTFLLRQRPSVLTCTQGMPLLEHLLRLGLSAMSAQHRGLCEDVLEWTKASIFAAVSTESKASPECRACLAQLLGLPGEQGSNWGPRLIDGILGAASGGMPSWMMSPLASCLYSTWQLVGSHAFCFWLDAALCSGMGAPPAWREIQPPENRWKALVGDGDAPSVGIISPAQGVVKPPSGRIDEKEFKKRLKALTGGKRKGGAGSAPPRDRTLP